eukprot:scaffold27008_cov67-Phaeocystis_antarctica.AAC.3
MWLPVDCSQPSPPTGSRLNTALQPGGTEPSVGPTVTDLRPCTSSPRRCVAACTAARHSSDDAVRWPVGHSPAAAARLRESRAHPSTAAASGPTAASCGCCATWERGGSCSSARRVAGARQLATPPGRVWQPTRQRAIASHVDDLHVRQAASLVAVPRDLDRVVTGSPRRVGECSVLPLALAAHALVPGQEVLDRLPVPLKLNRASHVIPDAAAGLAVHPRRRLLEAGHLPVGRLAQVLDLDARVVALRHEHPILSPKRRRDAVPS